MQDIKEVAFRAAREAGGKVTNATGGKFDIGEGHVIASNGKIHDELVKELNFAEKLMNSVAS